MMMIMMRIYIALSSTGLKALYNTFWGTLAFGGFNQSGIVIKFDYPNQNKPIANRSSDDNSRDMLMSQPFSFMVSRRPNQIVQGYNSVLPKTNIC